MVGRRAVCPPINQKPNHILSTHTSLRATQVFLPIPFPCRCVSSKSAATSTERIISSTNSLCGDGPEGLELEDVWDSSTSMLYANRTPLFSARRLVRRGRVSRAVSAPTNYSSNVSCTFY